MDKILDKLVKLRRHMESAQQIGSEAEAQAFAAMMQRLLAEHQLEMSDVEFHAYESAEPVKEFGIDYRKYPDLKVRKARINWAEKLASLVARAHFCQIVVHSGSSRLSLVGRKRNVEVAEYMIVTLLRLTEVLADDAYYAFWVENEKVCADCRHARKDHPHKAGCSACHCRAFRPNFAACRGFRPSWLNGFVRRLGERYTAEKTRLAQEFGEAQKAAGASVALMRLETEAKRVEDFFAGNKHFRASTALAVGGTGNAEGLKRGRDAADAVSLRSNGVKATRVAGSLGA